MFAFVITSCLFSTGFSATFSILAFFLPLALLIIKYSVGSIRRLHIHDLFGLSERGLLVLVVCEQVMDEVSPSIDVIHIEKSAEKPRWKFMLRYKERVEALLKNRSQRQKTIICNHERPIFYQVTVFMPPIDIFGDLSWLKKPGLRIRGWMQMERHVLFPQPVGALY